MIVELLQIGVSWQQLTLDLYSTFETEQNSLNLFSDQWQTKAYAGNVASKNN
jgi:hypothetical protein